MPLCDRCKTITDAETLRNVGGSCPTCQLDLSRHLVEGGAIRPHHEFQQAHDLLAPILLGQIPLQFDETSMMAINVALGVICWALYHDYNPAFGNNLAQLQVMLTEMGIERVPLPRTMTTEEMIAEGLAPEPDPPPGAFPDEDTTRPAFESEEAAQRFVKLVDVLKAGGCPPDCGHTDEEHTAFDLGLAAGERGKGESSNPYPYDAEGSPCRQAWFIGHSVGVGNRPQVLCASCGSTVIAEEVREDGGVCLVCQQPVCIYCGCTDLVACQPNGCSWVGPGICSSHPEKAEVQA